MKLKLTACVLLAALTCASAFGADSPYKRKRALYDRMSNLRSQNVLALAGGIDKKATQSKAWEEVTRTVSKEFGDDHPCYKVAHFSRASWTHMVFASAKSSPQDIDGAGSFGYQAGEWAGTCYDEIEKLDTKR